MRVREVNETIYGLNFLAGYGDARGRKEDLDNSMQSSVVSDIFEAVDKVPGDTVSMEGSFREILRGRAGYPADTTQGSLAPCQPPLLSVPADVSHAPYARDIVSDEALWMGLSA